MRAKTISLIAVLCAVPLSAHDTGRGVTFGQISGVSFVLESDGIGSRALHDLGESDPIAEAWDTVLIQGESSDMDIAFEASRSDVRDWKPLEIHRFADGRFWAKARLPKGSGPLRLRASGDRTGAAHKVVLYGIEVFVEEPIETETPAVSPRGSQNQDALRPFVHARAEWEAVSPTQPWVPDPLPWRITLHHSDGRYTRTLAQSKAEARFIQDFHIHGRGWSDIAYHFLVDSRGNIFEGRPEGTLGAHTLANNEGNIGIVLLGTYRPPINDVPTKAQLNAVAALCRYLVSRYGIKPEALKGHRDYKHTSCPGSIVYARLGLIRRAIAVPPPSHKSLTLPLKLFKAPSFDGLRRTP